MRLTTSHQFCYNSPSRFTCTPAALYCWQQIAGPISNVPINPYDVRRKCDRDGEDGPLCCALASSALGLHPWLSSGADKQMSWIETYLNQPNVKKTLGAPANLNFESCNMKVNQAFLLQGALSLTALWMTS